MVGKCIETPPPELTASNAMPEFHSNRVVRKKPKRAVREHQDTSNVGVYWLARNMVMAARTQFQHTVIDDSITGAQVPPGVDRKALFVSQRQPLTRAEKRRLASTQSRRQAFNSRIEQDKQEGEGAGGPATTLDDLTKSCPRPTTVRWRERIPATTLPPQHAHTIASGSLVDAAGEFCP